jgi:hypothetical protein
MLAADRRVFRPSSSSLTAASPGQLAWIVKGILFVCYDSPSVLLARLLSSSFALFDFLVEIIK